MGGLVHSSKTIWLASFALLLSAGCAGIKVPNTRACAVAGRIEDGGECVYTLSDRRESMTSAQFLDFLEPRSERGGAICQSAHDWARMKTALEQACRKLPGGCTYEVQAMLQGASKRVGWLYDRSVKHARRLKR